MRSLSVQRNGPARYRNPILQTAEDSPDGRSSRMISQRRSSQSKLDNHNISACAAKEVLKTSILGDPQENQNISSRMGPRESYRGTTGQRNSEIPTNLPNSWGEYMQKQGQIGNTIQQTERLEKILRAQKYKESLDQMIEEEKKRKIESHKEYIAPPNPDFSKLGAIIQMDKIREQEEKKHYSAQLGNLIRQQAELRIKEREDKYQENKDYRRVMDQVKEYDQQAILQEKVAQKRYYDANRSIIEQKHHDYAEQKRQERELALQSGQFLAKQDEERSRLYKNIQNRSEFYNLRANYICGSQYEKQRKIDNLVNKGIQEASEKEAVEMRRRQEAHQRLQTETFLNNKMQAEAKYSRAQLERAQKYGDYEESQHNKKMVDQIENMRKDLEINQKKDYLQFLQSQAHARQNSRNNFNNISADEQLMNFGKQGIHNGREENNPLLNGRSHERNLQLKYLDNWLQNSPPRGPNKQP